MSVKQGGNTIAGAVGKYPLNEHNISNCITNIPQDIKLELSSGTLTLKAGSKVYVPNGVGVFDAITIENDLTATNSDNDKRFIVLLNGVLATFGISHCYSGTTAPSGQQYMLWYDTENNLVKFTSDTGSTWSLNNTLPLGIITSNSTQITSIDQVFNGFGCIGSTVFALPGVKGLIPDGRNADGSLKSIEFTVNNVLTSTQQYAQTSPHYIALNANTLAEWDSVYWMGYNADKNIVYNKNGSASATIGEKLNLCICGVAEHIGTTKITSFATKTVFHALDYSDTEYMAHQAMPSSRYTDLTLGASGAAYTAPADGYAVFTASGDNYIYIEISGLAVFNQPSNANWYSVWCPVRKGGTFYVGYNAGATGEQFRFIYSQGEA